MISKKALLLFALGIAATLAFQHYAAGQSWRAAAQRSAEPPRRIETLDLPEPEPAPRPTRYGRTAPQDISVRVRSVAAEAREHIARTGQAVTNFYFGGASTTPVDADENDPRRYSGDLGSTVWEATHE